ncbi:MAG TPA: tRNA lysidine(34) synthetase TilS [Polyangiaceae bacterium]|nr:tRNA lysidine(34) synthetase TilS [Polyangiaceae bacterium]
MTESSHPPALLKRTVRTLREETPLARGDRVVVAVSGGGDSIALLHVLARSSAELGIQLIAHGVDHGLRPEAGDELDLAERLAQDLGVPFSRTVLSLDAGGNLQARAREARYAALDAVRESQGARWVATAHHADDRAETVLLRILRGASPRGLAVLPAASSGRLRPLIRSPKSAIVRHLERHELAFANDPSNRNPRFLRTRVRHELIPLLEDIAPGATAHLNHLADEWTDEEPVVVTDAQGHAVPVRRSQAAQIRQARKMRSMTARVWLAGGLEIIPRGDSSEVATSLAAASSNGMLAMTEKTMSDKAGLDGRRPDVVGTPAPASKKPRPLQQKQAARGAKPTKSD